MFQPCSSDDAILGFSRLKQAQATDEFQRQGNTCEKAVFLWCCCFRSSSWLILKMLPKILVSATPETSLGKEGHGGQTAGCPGSLRRHPCLCSLLCSDSLPGRPQFWKVGGEFYFNTMTILLIFIILDCFKVPLSQNAMGLDSRVSRAGVRLGPCREHSGLQSPLPKSQVAPSAPVIVMLSLNS